MKIQKNIWIYVMVGLFVPFQLLYADECDDIFTKAESIIEAAKESENQKNYERAIELYKEAAECYEQVANMQDCRSPKIFEASRNNAELCRTAADEFQKVMEEYAAEVKFYEEYNQAQEKYNAGNTYAKNREWDEAIAAFEEAAQMWESIGAATQSETGKKALRLAQQARDAADLVARKYQQNKQVRCLSSLSVKRIRHRITSVSVEELAIIIEGLNEIIGG